MNWNGDRADFGKVRPIEMKSAAADNSTVFFHYEEISNVFAQLRNTPRKQDTFASVVLDDRVNMLHIREDGPACL